MNRSTTHQFVRAPLALFGSEKCYFSIQKATELLAIKKHPSTIHIPEQGIVAIGSGDQDWGWTRCVMYSNHLTFRILYFAFVQIRCRLT